MNVLHRLRHGHWPNWWYYRSTTVQIRWCSICDSRAVPAEPPSRIAVLDWLWEHGDDQRIADAYQLVAAALPAEPRPCATYCPGCDGSCAIPDTGDPSEH